MKLIGRRSVASVLRWVLGFINVFVMLGVIATALGLVASLLVPSFAVGMIDGLRDSIEDPTRTLGLADRSLFLAAFVVSVSTWWILNRLRRIFLTVNQGDAFEPANVGRLRGIGLGLIGVQFGSLILAVAVPAGMDVDYSFDLGSALGILIVFMLAEVFRQGSAMRDDQQMTV